MSTFLSRDVQQGLDRARADDLKRKSRFRVQFDGEIYPILKLWETGFVISAEGAPHMRGLVDVFNGATHVYQCLIVASQEEHGEVHFEFKRNTVALDRPPLDFEQRHDAPVALLN